MSAMDTFANLNRKDLTSEPPKGILEAASRCFLITPHATNELAYVTRGISFGTAGALEVVLEGDTNSVVIPSGALAAGGKGCRVASPSSSSTLPPPHPAQAKTSVASSITAAMARISPCLDHGQAGTWSSGAAWLSCPGWVAHAAS